MFQHRGLFPDPSVFVQDPAPPSATQGTCQADDVASCMQSESLLLVEKKMEGKATFPKRRLRWALG